MADLAARAGISQRLAWLWPLIVDGTVLQATMAVLALAGIEGQQRNRRYFWIVLSASAAVSVIGNGWHAVLPQVGADALDKPPIADGALAPWCDVADVIVARGGHADVDTVAAALHLSYERNLSPKSIGRQLGVEHGLIHDIFTVGDELLRSGDVSGERLAV